MDWMTPSSFMVMVLWLIYRAMVEVNLAAAKLDVHTEMAMISSAALFVEIVSDACFHYQSTNDEAPGHEPGTHRALSASCRPPSCWARLRQASLSAWYRLGERLFPLFPARIDALEAEGTTLRATKEELTTSLADSEAGKLALVAHHTARRQALQDKVIDQDIQLQQVKAQHAEKLQETEAEHADRCTVLLSERDAAREAVVTRDATISDLLSQLDLKGYGLQEERAKSDGLQEELTMKASTIKRQGDLLDYLQGTKQQDQQTILQLQQKCREQGAEIGELVANLQASRAEVEAQKEQLQHQAEGMQVQAEEHAEQLASAHTTIQELQESKQQQSHAIDTLRKKLADEEAAHQKLQDSTSYQQLHWLQLDKQELQKRIVELQESNRSLWAQCKGDYERVASRKKHIACDSCTQSQWAEHSANQHAATLKQQLAKSETEKRELSDKLVTSQSVNDFVREVTLPSLGETISDLESTKKRLQEELQQRKAQLEALTSSSSSSAQQAQQLQQQVQQLSSSLAGATEQAQQQAASSAAEAAQLRQQVQQLTAAVGAFKLQLDVKTNQQLFAMSPLGDTPGSSSSSSSSSSSMPEQQLGVPVVPVATGTVQLAAAPAAAVQGVAGGAAAAAAAAAGGDAEAAAGARSSSSSMQQQLLTAGLQRSSSGFTEWLLRSLDGEAFAGAGSSSTQEMPAVPEQQQQQKQLAAVGLQRSSSSSSTSSSSTDELLPGSDGTAAAGASSSSPQQQEQEKQEHRVLAYGLPGELNLTSTQLEAWRHHKEVIKGTGIYLFGPRTELQHHDYCWYLQRKEQFCDSDSEDGRERYYRSDSEGGGDFC